MIPDRIMLPAAPRRIILHWTAGGPAPNSTDLKHYHYIVAQTCEVFQGVPVAKNMRALKRGDDYGAHTGGLNSFSIGAAWAGMANAVEGVTDSPYPITEEQTDAGCAFVAELCRAYALPVNERTVFTHPEAWSIHGIKGTQNHEKWDLTRLPWLPDLEPHHVGPYLRGLVKAHLKKTGPTV